MKKLDYGVVTAFANGTELWLEAITDEIDGFVLRDKDGTGIAVFPESAWSNGKMEWSQAHTKKYDRQVTADKIKDYNIKVEITFDEEAIISNGYNREDIYHALNEAFLQRGLRCSSENKVLSFVDAGHEDDYAHMWNAIKSLMISDWFLKCASSCTFFDDEDTQEDVLSQAWKFKR